MPLRFLTRRDNAVEVVRSALSLLKVPATSMGIEDDLERHPDYPSLLSVSDILTSYGVENISLVASIEQLGQVPLPAIVPLKIGAEESFAILLGTSPQDVTYQDPQSLKTRTVSCKEFERIWPTNVVVLMNAEDAKGDKNFTARNKIERNSRLVTTLPFAIIPCLAICTCLMVFFTGGREAILPSFFTLTNVAGLVLAGLLLWFEVDQYNPLLQEICRAGRKVNCNAVLNSNGARFFGISWSSIGFVYFSGAIFLLLTRAILDYSVLFALSWVNTFALPYVIFSIFYQWLVVKQWCPLCLGVQGILLLNVALSLLGGWQSIGFYNPDFLRALLLPFASSYAIPAAALMLIMPALKKNKVGQEHRKELYKFKHNLQFFRYLLVKQKPLRPIDSGLGITIGSRAPTIKIVKVCNPYCQPCSKAHAIMEELMNSNPDVQLQIIFGVPPDGDVRSRPVEHLLAIQDNYGEEAAKDALNYWYQSSAKDFSAFEKKYPVSGRVGNQREKIRQMYDWCETSEIIYTPTFFINGFQLPDIYRAEDLKNLLSFVDTDTKPVTTI